MVSTELTVTYIHPYYPRPLVVQDLFLRRVVSDTVFPLNVARHSFCDLETCYVLNVYTQKLQIS